MNEDKRRVYVAILLAVIAVIIWSGNFIIARGVMHRVPPVTLAFYRWAGAALMIFPFALGRLRVEWPAVRSSWKYLFWASLTGISLFNTFVYIGAHYTSAINLALIGTTSSPIIAVFLARIFLKEKIGAWKLTGMILCIAGVLYLLSRGEFARLAHLDISRGDAWVFLAATSFAIYNILVRKKPKAITGVSYLFLTFTIGSILLLPFYLYEMSHSAPVVWDWGLFWIVIYLSLGTSVLCFLFWNIAISRLGAGRTALFGNLIPVFSSIEAALILGEDFTVVHVVSMSLVFAGIVVANLKSKPAAARTPA